MAKGWNNKLTELLGEHLTASHLIRQGLIVSFTPKNMPKVDLLATNEVLKTLPIQLKTIRRGTAQLDAADFLSIEFHPEDGEKVRQVIKGKLRLSNPNMPYVFVWLGRDGDDRYYVCLARDIQKLVFRKYSNWLRTHKGIRPRNSNSTHCGVHAEELTKYQNRWDIITNHPVLK